VWEPHVDGVPEYVVTVNTPAGRSPRVCVSCCWHPGPIGPGPGDTADVRLGFAKAVVGARRESTEMAVTCIRRGGHRFFYGGLRVMPPSSLSALVLRWGHTPFVAVGPDMCSTISNDFLQTVS
jgi:hypothetical protein